MRQEDFERLYEQHAQALFGFLAYRVGDRATAEDLLSDTFERALRARRRFDPRRGSEQAWLYSIALNLVRDHGRRRASEQRALARSVDVEGGADAGLEAVEHRTQLGDALASLTTEEREAVALRYGADLTVPEIAKVIGEPLTTVEGRVYRALRKLRDALGDR